MKSKTLLENLKGTPMLDDEFDSASLLALVCAVRQNIDNSTEDNELLHYIAPSVAKSIYQDQNRKPVKPLESKELTNIEKEKVQTAIKSICKTVPQWSNYFSLPLVWERLTGSSISSTNPLIPQNIQLGDKSFSGTYSLEEHIVHEISHIWIALTLEVAPVSEPTTPTYTLPSGTSGKDMTQVILALTFSATAFKYYHMLGGERELTNTEVDRALWLKNYTLGCIETAVNSGKLVKNGVEVVESCKKIINSYSIPEVGYA